MTRLTVAVAFALALPLALALFACGGGGEPSLRLTIEADLEPIPAPADREAAMTALVDVLAARARAFGYPEVEIQRLDVNRLSLTLRGAILQGDARALMENRALLELQQPILNEGGSIACRASDGSQFSVTPQEITYEAAGVRLLPRCQAADGRTGEIIWQPVPTDSENPAVVFHPVSAGVNRTRAPAVVVNFAPSSTDALREATTRLVGVPLGIFVDGELLAAPSVQQPVITGNLVITGINLARANILAAQFNGGQLPVQVTVTSVETLD